jgi:hypothetical protein
VANPGDGAKDAGDQEKEGGKEGTPSNCHCLMCYLNLTCTLELEGRRYLMMLLQP